MLHRPFILAAAITTAAFAGPTAPPAAAPASGNPLSFADGRIVFDLQNRTRWEIRENNFDFNDAVRTINDDNWVLNRLRLGLAIKPVEWLTIYAQVQDSREWLSDRADIPGLAGADGDDAFDLRLGYIDIASPNCPWGLRLGRQTLAYGDERLIGTQEWVNLGTTFDAAKLTYKGSNWTLDAFAGTRVTHDRGQYNQSDLFNGNETHREQIFSGLYFSTSALGPQTTDFYALHLHQNEALGIGDTNFITLGARVKSKPGAFAPHSTEGFGKDAKPAPARPVGFDYDAEAAFQTGKVRGLDLTAFAVHAGIGYTFDTPLLPRLGLEYNYASGDDNALDGDIETFQNLFASNHKFYGYMDVIAWQNMHNLAASFKITPCKDVTIRADYHALWLAENSDSWYRANGTTTVRPLNAAAQSADSYLGSEVDLVMSWKVRKELTLEAGYSHFFAGGYLSDTGASDDADFGYVQATITF